MKKIDGCLNDFLATISADFSRLINMVELMRENMTQLKRESTKSQLELEVGKMNREQK
jgi:hypothetical protein